MPRQISLLQFCALVMVGIAVLTVSGWLVIDGYERERLENRVAREQSKLATLQEGSRFIQFAALRAHSRLAEQLAIQVERTGRYGEGRFDSIARLAMRRAMDAVFDGVPDYLSVELFDAQGHFLMGVENVADPGTAPRIQHLASPLSQQFTASGVTDTDRLQLHTTRLETRNGVPVSDARPVIYATSWAQRNGQPIVLLVMKYHMAPFYAWAARTAASYPNSDHYRVNNSGKFLMGGHRFGQAAFAADRGVANQGMPDLLPDLWQAMQQGQANRLRTSDGLYIFQPGAALSQLTDLQGQGRPFSVLYVPNASLFSTSFFRSTQGWYFIGFVYLACAVIAWGFWGQLVARRQVEAKDQALEVSLRRLHHATEFGQLGLLEVDDSKDWVYANDTFFTMHGLQPPGAEMPTLAAIDAMFPGYEAVQQAHAELADSLISEDDAARVETLDYDFEHPLLGARRYRMTIAVDREGGTPVLRTLYADISDLHEQSQALTRAAEQQTSMFKIIAHELRTPAAAANMIAQELPASVSERRDLLSTSGHLLSVIDDLRVTVNPDALIESRATDFNLRDLLEEAERQVRALYASEAMALDIEFADADKRDYVADAYRLRAVLTNLLRNSAYHSNGTRTRVSMEFTQTDGASEQVLIRVEDDGRGIPAASVDRLFDAFERGDTNVGGTGVGLHIARSWIELMGGTLVYEPSQMGGAGFVIRLSLALSDRSPSTERAESSTDAHPYTALRVLLVEDDMLIRKATERLLDKHFNAEVTVGHDGAEGLSHFESGDFDLIITDFLMPNLDGLQMIEAIRSAGGDVPIIALTAATMGDERNQLLGGGADLVMAKPITLEKLKACLQSLRPTGFDA